MHRIRTIIAELMTPDSFRDDWFKEGAAQGTKALMGVCAASITCFLWNSVAGELPHRWPALIVLVAFYLGIEVAQGWKAGDSWFDAFMWTLGVCGVIIPFREISPGWPTVHLELHMGWWFGIFAVFVVALFLRVLKRVPI